MSAILRYRLRVRCQDGQWRTQDPVERSYPTMAEAIERKDALLGLGVAAPSRAELSSSNPPSAAYLVSASVQPRGKR